MQDSQQRFLFDRFPVRGEVVQLEAAWQAVLERQDYPPAVRELLGQAMAASVLLSSMLKFHGTLTLQLQADGPLNLLVVQCTSELALRGLAKCSTEGPPEDFSALVGNGRLAITIERSGEPERYQGVVPLVGANLAECLQHYFRNSEQLPTRLWLAANEARIGGMLLQTIPDAKGTDDPDAWRRVQALAETVTDDELLTLPDRRLLRRLFVEEDVRVFEPQPVAFRCACSTERIETVLRALGRAEVDDIIAEQGSVSVRCEFCNLLYEYDVVDVGRVFTAAGLAPESERLH